MYGSATLAMVWSSDCSRVAQMMHAVIMPRCATWPSNIATAPATATVYRPVRGGIVSSKPPFAAAAPSLTARRPMLTLIDRALPIKRRQRTSEGRGFAPDPERPSMATVGEHPGRQAAAGLRWSKRPW